MIPTLSLSAVQATIARALALKPLDRARIEKAAALICLDHVHQLDASTFTVDSLTTSSTVYAVTPMGCECEGSRRYPARRCSHEWACRIVVAAQLEEERQREQAARGRFSADRVAVVFASARRAA